MIRSRPAWLASVLACGVLVAGCGSSSSTSTSSSGAAAAPASSSSSSTSAPATSSTSAQGSSSVQAQVAACKQTLTAQTALPQRIKSKLEADCVKAANGDKGAIKQAAREVCEEIIRSSSIPAGVAKEHALAACSRAK